MARMAKRKRDNSEMWCDGCLSPVTITTNGNCPKCMTDFFLSENNDNDNEVWDY
jgi:hypothetical protein